MTKTLYYLSIPLQVPLVAALGVLVAGRHYLQLARQGRYAADQRRHAELLAQSRRAKAMGYHATALGLRVKARALAESWRRRRGWPLVLYPEEA